MLTTWLGVSATQTPNDMKQMTCYKIAGFTLKSAKRAVLTFLRVSAPALDSRSVCIIAVLLHKCYC